MKLRSAFHAVIIVAACSVNLFAQQADNSVEIQGYQYAYADKANVLSQTMNVIQDGGQFKQLDEDVTVLQLAPCDFLECRFKLPESAFNVKAVITYNVNQNENVRGRIRWNKTLLPEDQAGLLMNQSVGLTQKEIQLKDVKRENELRIVSLSDSLQIRSVKISYMYRMPICTVKGVTVKLLSPDPDIDVLRPDLKLKWEGIGECKKGWVTFKYKDGNYWKTVPGADAIDIGDEEWKDFSEGSFVWKNHGLKDLPTLKIEFYEGEESQKHINNRLAAEKKKIAEQAEKTRQAEASRKVEEAKRFSQNKKFDEALVKIDEALRMYPNNDNFKRIRKDIVQSFLTTGGGYPGHPIVIKEINGVEFVFRWIPVKTFKNINKGFWMMETEVTQKQWQAVKGNNPSLHKGDDLPVETVSLKECQDFCRKCSEMLGKTVQLPTEEQWISACRAEDSKEPAYELDDRAWYISNSNNTTHPVKSKKPNTWGIYNMQGNVWEWCEIGNAPNSLKSPICGGSIKSAKGILKSISCIPRPSEETSDDVGFRCVINSD